MTSENRRHHSEELYFHAINRQAIERLKASPQAKAGSLAEDIEKTIEQEAMECSANKFIQVLRLAIGLHRAQVK